MIIRSSSRWAVDGANSSVRNRFNVEKVFGNFPSTFFNVILQKNTSMETQLLRVSFILRNVPGVFLSIFWDKSSPVRVDVSSIMTTSFNSNSLFTLLQTELPVNTSQTENRVMSVLCTADCLLRLTTGKREHTLLNNRHNMQHSICVKTLMLVHICGGSARSSLADLWPLNMTQRFLVNHRHHWQVDPKLSGLQWGYSPPRGRGCWECSPLQTGWWWRTSRAPEPCSKYQRFRRRSPPRPRPTPLHQESTPYKWLYLSQQPLRPPWWPSPLRSGWLGRYLILTSWMTNQQSVGVNHLNCISLLIDKQKETVADLNWSDHS